MPEHSAERPGGLLRAQIDASGRSSPELLRQALRDYVELDCEASGEWVELGPSPHIVHPYIYFAPSQQVPDPPNPCADAPNLCRIAGLVTDIAIDPAGTADTNIWIACSGGGVWRTIDGGNNWECKTDQLLSVAMGAVALDPLDSNIVYAGSGPIFEAPSKRYYRSIGLYKSIDAGDTWFLCDGGFFATVLRDKGINRIVFPSPDVLLVATGAGLYRSVDGGLNFGNNPPAAPGGPGFNNGKPVREGRITGLAPDTQQAGVVYVAVSTQGLFRSIDGGITFPENLFDGVSSLPAGYRDVVFTQSTLAKGVPDNSTFYAAVTFIGPWDGGTRPQVLVFRSKGGHNWEPLPKSTSPSITDSGNEFTYNLTLGVDPQNPERVYLGLQTLWLSIFGGLGFNRCDSNQTSLHLGVPKKKSFGAFPVHTDHHELVFSPPSHWASDNPRRSAMVADFKKVYQAAIDNASNNQTKDYNQRLLDDLALPRTTIVVGTDGGIYRNLTPTEDLDGWEAMHVNGIGSMLGYGVEIGRGLPQKTIMAGFQDNGTATYDGPSKEWTQHDTGDGYRSLAIDPADPKYRYAQATEALDRSQDGGLTWSNMGAIPGPDTKEWRDRGLTIERTGTDPKKRRIYAWKLDTLSRSDDAGSTYTTLRSFGETINCVGTQPDKPAAPRPDEVWVGMRNGEIHYSSDAGKTWDQKRFCPKPGGTGPVECIAIHPIDGRVVAVYSGYSSINPQFSTRHVFLTGDKGDSWRDISGGLGPKSTIPDMPVYSAAFYVDPAGKTSIRIATAAGVLITRDDGQTWKILGVGLPPVDCTCVALDATKDPPLMVASTFGRGCWELRAPEGKPRIRVQANAAFGPVPPGETGKLRIRIFNSGDLPLTVSAFDTSGCPAEIRVSGPAALPPLAAGDHADVELTFQPAAPGAVKGTIGIKSDDPARPTWLMPVSGIGVAASPVPRIGVEPLALQFGRIHTSDLRTLTTRILNAGTTAAQVTAFKGGTKGFSGPTGPPLTTTLPFGGEADFKIGFQPTKAYSIFFATGQFDADYQVSGNDPHAPLTLHASGNRIGGAFPLLEILLIATGVGLVLLGIEAFEALFGSSPCGEQ